MIFGLKFLIWLILILVLTSSSSGPTDVSEPEHVAPGRSTEVDRRPATFDESYRWIDGVAVEVVEVLDTALLATTTVDEGRLPGVGCHAVMCALEMSSVGRIQRGVAGGRY